MAQAVTDQQQEAQQQYEQQLREWRERHDREKQQEQPTAPEGSTESARVQWCIDRIVHLETELARIREQLDQRPEKA